MWDDSQPDLFIALPSDIPARDQQDLMERPFFSLAKNKRTTPIEYEVGGNYICVTANEKYGIATIWDADILIWAASQITEALSKGLKTSRFFRLSAYDLLTFMRRGTSGRKHGQSILYTSAEIIDCIPPGNALVIGVAERRTRMLTTYGI